MRALRQARTANVFAVACSSPGMRAARGRCTSPARCPRSIAIGWRPEREPERVIDVPMRTLDDILDEAAAPVGFDLLSVDVEGHELEVLSGFDFATLAAAADPARGSRRGSRTAPLSEACRLSPDPPLREQRLVCAERRSAVAAQMGGTLADRAQILSGAAVSGRAQRLAAASRSVDALKAQHTLGAGPA